ncbi:hypothetical protein MBLNU459_g1183t1 [Dothideomycetes sp. NU459]
MSANTRPPARRNPSSGWGRLKPAQVDPLEVYGLPSKGETRLSDPKTQETYFERIVARYMKFCASCGSSETLDSAFAAISLASSTSNPPSADPAPHSAPRSQQSPPSSTSHPPSPSPSPPPPPQELPTLLMAMRKLREALVAAHRTDAFAQRAYMFIVHATLLCRHLESYHPALLYLLLKIHPRTPLSQPELREFAAYLVLDLACRQHDFDGAYRAARRYGVADRRVRDVLRALVRDDFVLFWKVGRAVDGYQRTLLQWSEEGMRVHALKCLGRAYMSADRPFVERCADKGWEELVKSGVGWELGENGTVTIRRPKAK